MVEIIPNWHPIFVHFTIALLSVAALLKIGALAVGSDSLREQFQVVARWNIWIGAGFVILTVLSGVFAYNSVSHDTPSHAAMTDHRNWALVTSGLFLVLAVWLGVTVRAGQANSGLFVVILLAATSLLGVTAWKGGELVYRYGLGVMSLPKADTHGHADGEQHEHQPEKTDGHDHADGHHDETKPETHVHDNSDGHHDAKKSDDHHDQTDHHHDKLPETENSSSNQSTQPTSKTRDDHYADGHTH